MAQVNTIGIEFLPNETQKLFIESQARADLFSSRMGEGKSAALCWANYYHVHHNPGAPWAFIRDTWENLRRTTLQEFFRWFPPGIFGDWSETKKTYTWRIKGMGDAPVYFMGMDDPKDASALQSLALAGFAIDEPAPAAESGGVPEMIFDTAMSRLRYMGNIKWYAAKLATNNPDEAHWTYRRFVDPGAPDHAYWQPRRPENLRNLPPNYYEGLRSSLIHRPDLVKRFVDGKFGFQQIGTAVTPEWDDERHLATGLIAVPGRELILCWDFGLNPTCLITQITPMGHWHILEAFVGDEIGVLELIESVVKPTLASRYPRFNFWHCGDPAGAQREQSSSEQTAVRTIRRELGGKWRPGAVKSRERIPALRAALQSGHVLVDRHKAAPVWHALRGGWHHHVARTGVVSLEPQKDMHSHPGDAMSYGASVLFPMGKLKQRKPRGNRPKVATFMGSQPQARIGRKPEGLKMPQEARMIGTDRDRSAAA